MTVSTSGLVLLMCGGLMLSGGMILGASTAWSLARMSYYMWTTDVGMELSSAVMIIAGSMLCLPACWVSTLVPYTPKVQPLSVTLMFLTTGAMVLFTGGICSMTALSRVVREPHLLNHSMLNAMENEAKNPAVRSAFASMQLEAREPCEYPVFNGGCLLPAISELRSFINGITILSSCMVLILGVSLFSASYVLVNAIMGKEEVRKTISPQTVRIACVHSPPPCSQLAALTSPAFMPTDMQTNQI